MSLLQNELLIQNRMAASAPAAEPTLCIEIEADATTGYAAIQNAIPVLRALRLTNLGAAPLENLEVVISCSPVCAHRLVLRFERLGAGKTRRIAALDLLPDHAFLADLQEPQIALLRVVAQAASRELASASRPVQVLAHDQWAAARALPELLAAFCMPDSPAVAALVGKAGALLRATDPALSMDGYASKSRDTVWKQLSAIYSVIAAEGLHDAEPPASLASEGQKIRSPERILQARVATCLDLSMLFAACLENAGLRPVVLLSDDQAWVGVWLHEACFASVLTDDAQAIRKRVDSGEFLVFETTGVAREAGERSSLRLALAQGHGRLLDEASFRYAVDIYRARQVQVKPLPSRALALAPGVPLPDQTPAPIEPMPLLPPLDADALVPLEICAADTPEGRLAIWKSRLLDLTLRNRMLNFKPTKATLQFVAPDLARLEQALAGGAEFTLRALPELMEGADPRLAQLNARRAGALQLDDMGLQALGRQELLARATPDVLDANLLAIYSAARTGLEESGANTLYLAMGLLQWTEAGKGDAHLAPLLLIPVTLQRQSVRSGFRLIRHEDEALVNPTLLHLLKTSFGLKVAGLDAAPGGGRGVHVAQVLQSLRLAVREMAQWEVLEQAYLGIFSFTKHLMWKDLQERTAQLRLSRVVRHLIDRPGEGFAREGAEGEFDRLDATHAPQDILAPLLADSSQLKAICAVDAGRDLVLEGPPGTGKSQTIANLIAHSLAKGKTVLFVSEKMAALSMVQRRLADIGLGPFCLELHSARAKRGEVLQQLGKSLGIGAQRPAGDWAHEAARLGQLRQVLNGLVDALHGAHPVGFTVFEAIGTCIAHEGEQASTMPWADPRTHDRATLERLQETVGRMAALAGALGALDGCALSLIGHSGWTPSWQDALLEAAESLNACVGELQEKAGIFSQLTGLSATGLSLERHGVLDQLAEVLLLAPAVPLGLARQAHDPAARVQVRALAQHGQARSRAWKQFRPGWTAQVATLKAAALQSQWAQASVEWWPRSQMAQRAVSASLSVFRCDGQRPSDADIEALLVPLAALNVEDQALRALHAAAQALLQESYASLKTDWASVAAHARWAGAFADAVALVAGGDAELIRQLHQALQPLVAENRADLSAQGPAGRALLAYRQAWQAFTRQFEVLKKLAEPVAPLQGPVDAADALERIQAILNRWQAARRLIHPWCLWREVRQQALEQGLQALVSSLETGAVPLSRVQAHFNFSYRHWWLKKTIDADPLLRSFSSADHTRKLGEFRQADARFQALTEQYIVATLSERTASICAAAGDAGESELARLRRELQKKSGHLSVRQLVQALPTLLPRLKPCLLMSPLSVAQYLDAGYAPFDLVVFDEASQIPVWDAVGAIARGRQVVVVGDAKQLPPASFFAKSSEIEGTAAGDEPVRDLESILEECLGAGMNRLSLQWHYRSRHESLITFSNVNYYDASLITFPSPLTHDSAVRFEPVTGFYDRGASRTNAAEAQAIAQAIGAHYLCPSSQHLTLGVVTFNQPQQALIETLVDARRRSDPELDRAMAACAHEPLFIKNLENVQGDERDVIFFSVTYGPDAGGKMTMNFGPLNAAGGQRRLNVAISRARQAVVIYSTLVPEQIDLARVRAAGVRDLKHYLAFAIEGYRALVAQSVPRTLEPGSAFEVAVIRMLRSRGWRVHPQVGCSGYRIDLAVVDPRAPGRYLAGIECDGASYRSGASSRDRDRLRQHVLEGLGWHIVRIWSTDWWLNPEGEIDKIALRLEEIMVLEPAGDAALLAPVSSFEAEAACVL